MTKQISLGEFRAIEQIAGQTVAKLLSGRPDVDQADACSRAVVDVLDARLGVTRTSEPLPARDPRRATCRHEYNELMSAAQQTPPAPRAVPPARAITAAEQAANRLATALMRENPGMTAPQAVAQVYTQHSDLYEQMLREQEAEHGR